MSDVSGLGLQSGFVVAVLIAAVFLAERLGGSESLLRRAMQVVMAIAITLTVFAATTAFIRPPEAPESENGLFDFGDSQESQEQFKTFFKESAERTSEAGTIHIGAGIALAAIGGAALRRLRVLPTALLLGGTLLLLLGAAPSGAANSLADTFSLLYGPAINSYSDAGQARDIARFIVLLAGLLLLFGFTYWRWESPDGDHAATRPPSEPEGDFAAGA